MIEKTIKLKLTRSGIIIKLIRRRKKVKRPKISKTEEKIYLENKALARKKIVSLVERVNSSNLFKYGRVAIRNQRRVWGSCSKAGNLNFNYRIMFLPERLQEYIIAHELCHLKEFNHGKGFWELLESSLPGAKNRRKELKNISISSLGLK